MRSHKSLILILWYMLSICLVTVGAQNYCYGAENFTTDGAYARNREILLSSLSSKVVQSEGFFYTTEAGKDPDKVYGYALCGGDATAEECRSCINSTSHEIKVGCPYQKEAYWWDGAPACLVRYADQPILGQAKDGISFEVYNTGSIPSSWTNFDEIWIDLVNRTMKEASAGSSRLKFATNEADLPRWFQTIYALMQCTPDLDQSTCFDCLRQRAAKYLDCCHGYQGGVSNSPNCMFRWELFPFYKKLSVTPTPALTNDTPVATSPSAAGSNKGIFLSFQ